MKALNSYMVQVKTSAEGKDKFTKRDTEEGPLKTYPCENGNIIVVTSNPSSIFRILGDALIESITRVEPGFYFE